MTVKEFKERANAKVQVLIQSNMLYDVYHSRTDENYLYVDGTDFDDYDVDFIRVHNHPEKPLVFFKFNKNSPEANLEFLYRNRETGEEFVIFAKKD